MLTAAQTTVWQLMQIVKQFVDERNWQQFHTPKNISMALAIEASELMEHFQWLTAEESLSLAQDPQKLADVGEELVDGVCYALALANRLELDLSAVFEQKMAKNRLKYPLG